jgi:hemoglobin
MMAQLLGADTNGCAARTLGVANDLGRRASDAPPKEMTMGVDVKIALLERLGGAVVIDRLVEAFYLRMDTLSEAAAIRTMHPADLAPIKADLKLYLTEWTGGPKLYSAEKGRPQMRQRHIEFPIGDAERDAWLLCMRGALSETVADAAARTEIDAGLSKLADWIRNTDNPQDGRESYS